MLQLILVYSPRPVCLLPFLGANIFSYGFSSRTAECSLVFFPMDGNVQVGDSAATLLLDADDDFISLVFLSNRHLFLKENRLLVVVYYNIIKICRLTGGTTQLED